MWWAPAGSERLGQNSVKVGQPWSNLVKPPRNLGNVLRACLGVLLMWRVPVGFDQLSPGCLVLRANTRENPGGKNRVMTLNYNIFYQLN
jgi:hypothetical protein